MNLVRWLIWSWFWDTVLLTSSHRGLPLGILPLACEETWWVFLRSKDIMKSVCVCVCVCVCARTQSCLSLWLHDCSPLDSSVLRIFQAKILQWVDIPSSKEHSQFRDWTHVSFASCIGRHILYHWAIWESHRRRGHLSFPRCAELPADSQNAAAWVSPVITRKQKSASKPTECNKQSLF